MRLPLLLSALSLGLALQAQSNISFVGQLSYQALRNSDVSNLWGYTDELGNEYALVGVNGSGGGNPGGISVVSSGGPHRPARDLLLPWPHQHLARSEVWGDYAYVTTEAADGELTIVDLSPLPPEHQPQRHRVGRAQLEHLALALHR
jgi:hypothetical protein